MKSFLLLFFGCLAFFIPGIVMANHMQGGELRVEHVSGNRYQISLITYYDANGRLQMPETTLPPEQVIRVTFFSKATKLMVDSFRISMTDSTQLNYSIRQCTNGSVVTLILRYNRTVDLDPIKYSNPAGYYASFERCCRNVSIDNIQNPSTMGLTYYCEFPALLDAKGRRNSNPKLSQPGPNYACIGRPYLFNFFATDSDGDSLVYSLVTPLRGHTRQTATSTTHGIPGPYAPILWEPGYDDGLQITGDPYLEINDSTGAMVLTPDRVGLFAYAVRVMEYRDGVKIGEVRREFQLYVQDCPVPPRISGNIYMPNSDTRLADGRATIAYTQDHRVKVKIQVKDTNDLSTQNRNATFRYQMSLQPLNYTGNILHFYKTNTNTPVSGQGFTSDYFIVVDIVMDGCVINEPKDTLKSNIIFTVIQDCPGNVTDSIPLKLHFSEPVILSPVIKPDYTGLSITVNGSDTLVNATVGDLITFKFTATRQIDTSKAGRDSDTLRLEAYGRNFKLNQYNGFLKRVTQRVTELSRIVTLEYTYKPTCEDLLQRRIYIKVAGGNRICGRYYKEDSVLLPFRVRVRPAERPLMSAYIAETGRRLNNNDTLYKKPGQKVVINFNAVVDSNRLDSIVVSASGKGFSDDRFNSVFYVSPKTSAQINWPLDHTFSCEDQFRLMSITTKVTSYLCSSSRVDSFVTNYIISDNNKPAALTTDLSLWTSTGEKEYTTHLKAGEILQFNFLGNDPDTSFMQLKYRPVNFDPAAYNMQFRNTSGALRIQSPFVWQTSCEQVVIQPMPLILEATLSDSFCTPAHVEKMLLYMYLEDSGSRAFTPVNVLTVNNDGINDLLEGPKFLPFDNCAGTFQSIDIFNRWGNPIYHSTDYQFKWDPHTFPAGMYWYIVKFSDQTKSSWLNLMKP
ncbi:MAG: gliding motility-associated C-terminal domain-containing protein [Bacteroidota bacterium]